MSPRLRSQTLSALMLAAASAGEVIGQEPVQPMVEDGASVAGQALPDRRPATLHRLVRHFDFEEAEDAPYTMPLHWYRYAAEDGASAQGFPPFGFMRLTNEFAYSGNWSFEFELDGGSLAARVPTAVIPVMPLADYVVLVRVRTKGLDHARAGLSAWLHNQRGEAIESSRAQSRLIKTNGEWETLAVQVHGHFEDAADLVIELQLLQPGHFVRDGHPAAPLLEDVRGRAWFDDVTVWHVPHVDMVLTPPSEPADAAVTPARLTMMVLDLAHDELRAQLRVFDLEGKVVLERHFPAPRTPIPRTVELPLERYGWYRAVLDVTHEDELTARRTLDFVHLPPRPYRAVSGTGPGTSFALAMPESWRDHADEVPKMARQAGARLLVLPVLTRDMRIETAREMHRQSRVAVEQLRRDEIEIVFSLSTMPQDLARHLGVSGDDVLFALKADDSVWREYLDELLVNFAFEVERWQVGPTGVGKTDGFHHARGGGEGFWHHDLAEIVSSVRRGLSRFVPEPRISLPLPVEHVGLPRAGEDARTIVIPYSVRPDAIGMIEGLARNRSNGGTSTERNGAGRNPQSDDITILESPPADLYRPHERVADFAFRVLHAWRTGLSTIAIAPPWTIDQDNRLMPEPTLGVWSTLNAHLTGRRFAGDLALGPGLHAWILEGEDPDDAALIAWSDRRPMQDSPPSEAPLSEGVSKGNDAAPRDSFSMQLSEGAVLSVDLFGNSHVIPIRSGEHTVLLTEMPRLIEGISAPLVKFRGGFTLDPPLVPSELRAHEHAIVLRNPWDMTVSGTIQLVDDPRWRMMPRSQSFTIRPGEKAYLPVQIILDRGILAGRKKLRAHLSINADANYRLDLETEFDVGLPDVEVTATWHVVRNVETGDEDLVITQYILNTSDPETSERTVNADAFVVAPNVRQERRLISGLMPGELAVRSFHIPGGARLLAGRSVRVGLSSRDSAARLNLVLDIPELVELTPVAAVQEQE